MTIRQFFWRATNHLLRARGYQLRRIQDDVSMEGGLFRRADSGLAIGTIIDVGASDGRWSKSALQYFPNAFCLLIEANKTHEPRLQQFKASYPNSEYQIVAAGDTTGGIYFDDSASLGGFASHSAQAPNSITVPVTTIDTLVRLKNLRPPYLLKLDTHGFELPILNGASESFKDIALIIIEVYNFKIASDSLKFWEMCSFLEAKGFRPIDLCEILHRPTDRALWQMDMFFVPSSSPEFESNDYQPS